MPGGFLAAMTCQVAGLCRVLLKSSGIHSRQPTPAGTGPCGRRQGIDQGDADPIAKEEFMLRVIALTASAALFCSGALAADGNVGGNYNVLGKNPNGSEYSGTAEIIVTTESTCRIIWTTGSTNSEGICMRNDNAFAAGYVLGEKVGLVIYQMMDDGSMAGLWTVADEPGVGTEILTPR
jgi:hypothetical protein